MVGGNPPWFFSKGRRRVANGKLLPKGSAFTSATEDVSAMPRHRENVRAQKMNYS